MHYPWYKLGWLAAVVAAWPGLLPPCPAAAGDATVSYGVEDYESGVLPQIMFGLSWNRSEYQNVHGGKRCIEMAWDLTSWSKPPPEFSAGFIMGKPLLGRVKNLRAWIYAPRENLGTVVSLHCLDQANAEHIARATLTQAGWSQVTFPLTDGNIQWPVRLAAIKTRDPRLGPGHILLDDITAESEGQPRDLIQCRLSPESTDFAGGPQPVTYTLTGLNNTPVPQAGITLSVTVTDGAKRQLFEQAYSLPPLVEGRAQSIRFTPPVPYGVFTISWTASDPAGAIPCMAGSASCARLLADCSPVPAKPAENRYMREWGLPGGVFWQYPPERAVALGANWERFGWPNWAMIELSPGKYNFASRQELADCRWKMGLDLVDLECFYTSPSFYTIDKLAFGPAYGRMYTALAAAQGPRMRFYEFGNEENGPTKFLYTEYTRHGIAGARSRNAGATFGNAGTAYVDVGWLQMQARRGLFDRLDALVTHPYSSNYSPDEFGMAAQLAAVDDIIDSLGGMKVQFTTEFGYDHPVGFENMAKWLPRHFALAAAGGILKHGLYAWDGHFGITDNSTYLPPAVSVNAFCALTRGRQFAGWLRNDQEVRAAVFERAGIPLVMAWSQAERGTLSLAGVTRPVTVRDLNGNPQPTPAAAGGAVTLALDGRPVYVEGLSSQVTLAAWRNQAAADNVRYRKVLAASERHGQAAWETLAADAVSAKELRAALMAWRPVATPVSKPEQAVIAQLIRRLILATRMEALAGTEARHSGKAGAALRRQWQDYLEKSVAADVDLPWLRWMLMTWEKVAGEGEMLAEGGNSRYAAGLASLDPVFDRLCNTFRANGEKVFYPVWPYLYASAAPDGTITERLKLAPEVPTPVHVRLHSYSAKTYDAKVALELPGDWTCEPKAWTGKVEPGKDLILDFKITAGSHPTDVITAVLTVPGQPVVRLPFDNLELLPPVSVTAVVMPGLLPGRPLVLKVQNHGDKPVSGTLRLAPTPDLPALATAEIAGLKPGEVQTVSLALPPGSPVPAFNSWNLVAQIFLADGNGKFMDLPLSVDFSVCVKAPAKITVDGDLADWAGAAPNYLDKEEYTRGSYAGRWNREDLSAVVYTMWDENYLYLAAKVSDQTFQQAFYGLELWMQDSLQLGFAPVGQKDKYTEIGLALTPKGPQVFGYTKNTLLPDVRLTVRVTSGLAVYECAIPWSELPGIKPVPGGRCRFDILLNDDDAIIPRRYMERYGVGIVNTKDPEIFGYLDFVLPAVANSAPAVAEPLFKDDFNEYAAGQSPHTWQRVIHLPPAPESVVRAGVGRNGSKALVMNNTTGQKECVYLNLARPLKMLKSGEVYVLSAWVKGGGTTGIGVASNIYGVEGFTYIPMWKPGGDWQKVQVDFTAAGSLYLILGNSTKIDNLVIDDIEIWKKP